MFSSPCYSRYRQHYQAQLILDPIDSNLASWCRNRPSNGGRWGCGRATWGCFWAWLLWFPALLVISLVGSQADLFSACISNMDWFWWICLSSHCRCCRFWPKSPDIFYSSPRWEWLADPHPCIQARPLHRCQTNSSVDYPCNTCRSRVICGLPFGSWIVIRWDLYYEMISMDS